MSKKTKMLLLECILMLVICFFSSKTLLISFLWIILHEVTHIIVGRYYNVDTYSFRISIVGVNAELKNIDDLNDKKNLYIYLSGPIFNLIMFFIFLILVKIIGNNEMLIESAKLNIGFFIFNMLPVYPLDGAKIYEILLNKKFLYRKAKKILISISFILSILTICFFFLTLYIHKSNISLLLTSILLTYSTYKEKRNITYVIITNLVRKRRRIISNGFIENRSISVYYKKELVCLLSLIEKNRLNSFFILDENLKCLGIIYEDELIDALKDYGNITVEEFLKTRKK